MSESSFVVAGASDVGKVREQNEDGIRLDEELGFFAVADGVGGHAAGEVASALAVEAAAESVAKWRASGSPGAAIDAAKAAVEAACVAVHARAVDDHAHRGMSTTLTLVIVEQGRVAMGHVGDSRLYLVRGGRFDQMSSDQTLAAELARLGVIEKDQVEYHPHAHVLTQSLGSQPSVLPETLEFELNVDDILVLATDGLNPVVRLRDAFLDAIERDVEATAKRLIDAANAEGGRDNTSVVVLRRVGEGTAGTSLPDMLRPAAVFGGISTAGLLRVAQVGRVEEVIEASMLGNLTLAAKLAPGIQNLRVIRTWAGLNTTADGKSIIGPLAQHPNLFVAVPGDAGYTLGPLVGGMAADMVLGRSPDLDPAPYSPDRFN